MTETADTTDPGAGASESTPDASGGDTSESNAGETTPAESSADTNEAADDTVDSDTAPAEDALISEEEFEKLQDDPAALRKALQSAYTKKTQQLGPASQLLKLLQKDPKAAIRALAQTQGIKIPDSDEAAVTEPVKDQLLEVFENVLGPESAKSLKPALEKFIEEKIKPIKDAHNEQMAKAHAELTKSVENQFSKMRPDWKQHEPKMIEVAKRFGKPGPDVSPLEYLDTLYVAATHPGAAMKHAEKLVERINKSARAVSESKVSGVAPSAVTKKSDVRYKTPGDAARAAIRGE